MEIIVNSMDDIVFLGTGGSRFVTAKQLRATGGIVVHAGKEQLHIDPGPGTLVRAKQFDVDVSKNTIVLASHEHVDNTNDVNAVVDAMTYGGINKKGYLVTDKTFFEGYLTDFHKNSLKQVVVLEPGKKTKINSIIIEATKTTSHQKSSIGFKIFTPNFVLGYTGDTAYFAGLGEQFKNVDVLIVNNVMAFKKRVKNHLCSDDTVKLLKKAKPSLAIIQHFGKTVLDKNPMYEARDIQKQSQVQVIAATDGLVVDPISYAAKAKQKTLAVY